MTGITIRNARPATSRPSRAFMPAPSRTAPPHSKSSRRTRPKWRARHGSADLANGYPYLVAGLAGKVAGYAYAGPYRARPAYKWTVEDSIYIAPEFHRRGIGALLLARLVEEAQARGFRQMIAVIGDSAQIASIAVHEKAGFTHIGTLRSVGFKHGAGSTPC
jgi:L-amino acid N-acyltransferase YncA